MSRDLMHADELRAVVRGAYAAIDSTTEAVAMKLYSAEELAEVPRSAVEGALGVGNHLRLAEIEAGETILDLGCGAGIDSVLAARRTGPTGRVIALDFLPEMLERTAAAAAEAGLANIETLEAEMEAIPLPDVSVDHVISNGVINLSARKRRVLAECARAGFGEIEVHYREAVSVDDLALYPLFTPELIQLMRTLIPAERQDAVATSVVITARRQG